MRAAWFDEFGARVQIRECDDPRAPDDGVVLRVGASGVCRSDWHGWQGHDADIQLPHVPGHELAGTVEQVGPSVRNWKVGDRVTVPFCLGCGHCEPCRAGNQQVCANYFQPGFTAWGSFAELVALPYADGNLVSLPDSMGFDTAAALGCRYITAYRGVVAQGRIRPGEWLAVHGCGGVGLSAIQIGVAAGARVIAVDVRKPALEKARSLGAHVTVNARDNGDVAATIGMISGGGAHVSVDALGSTETCRNSIACLRTRGRHVQLGLLSGDDLDPPLPMHLVIGKELEVIGSHGMQAHAYPEVFEQIESGALRPQELIGKRIALDELPEELASMGEYAQTGMTVIDSF